MNELIKQMISYLLKFPYLVNQIDSLDAVNQKITDLPDSKLLHHLFTVLIDVTNFKSVNFTGRETKESLINIYFKGMPKTQKWLNDCNLNDKSINRKNVRVEFEITLIKAKGRNPKEINHQADVDFIFELEEFEKKEEERREEFLREFPPSEILQINELKKENENLKKSLELERNIRSRDYVDKDRVKSERNSWLVIAFFMVLLAAAYVAQDEWLCNGYDCIAI